MQNSLYQYLKSNLVFSRLDTDEFHIVEDYLYFQALEPKDYLMHEGDQGDFVAFVVLGRLDVIKHDNTKSATLLTTLQAGDSIGEMALIDELSRSASVKALEKTGIIILPKPDFEQILQDHPKIGIKMLTGLATMLSLNLRRTSETLTRQISQLKSTEYNPAKSKAS